MPLCSWLLAAGREGVGTWDRSSSELCIAQFIDQLSMAVPQILVTGFIVPVKSPSVRVAELTGSRLPWLRCG